MKQLKNGAVSRLGLRAAVIGGLAMLAACAAPPPQTTTTTTSEETTSQPAGPTLSPSGTLQPMAPGSSTTSSYSQTTGPSQ